MKWLPDWRSRPSRYRPRCPGTGRGTGRGATDSTVRRRSCQLTLGIHHNSANIYGENSHLRLRERIGLCPDSIRRIDRFPSCA